MTERVCSLCRESVVALPTLWVLLDVWTHTNDLHGVGATLSIHVITFCDQNDVTIVDHCAAFELFNSRLVNLFIGH